MLYEVITAIHKSRQQRSLRTDSEILNLPANQQIIFADGLLGAILAYRRPYYEQRFMAGQYHPNPFYPPSDRVRVKTRFGHASRRIVKEPVPARYASYPQYAHGEWSFVEGYRSW